MEKKLRKKVMSAMCLIAVLLTINGRKIDFEICVFAAENVKIIASTSSGHPGDFVDIIFSVGNNPGTTMYELYIEYDSNILEVVSVDDGGYYPQWFETDIAVTPLYISAGDALSLTNLSECKNLATVHFKIKEGAQAGEYGFSVEGLFLNANLDEFIPIYEDMCCITVLSTEDDRMNKTNIAEDIIGNSDNKSTMQNNNDSDTHIRMNENTQAEIESNYTDSSEKQTRIENLSELNKKDNGFLENAEVISADDKIETDKKHQEENSDSKLNGVWIEEKENHEKKGNKTFKIVLMLLSVDAGVMGGVLYYKRKIK